MRFNVDKMSRRRLFVRYTHMFVSSMSLDTGSHIDFQKYVKLLRWRKFTCKIVMISKSVCVRYGRIKNTIKDTLFKVLVAKLIKTNYTKYNTFSHSFLKIFVKHYRFWLLLKRWLPFNIWKLHKFHSSRKLLGNKTFLIYSSLQVWHKNTFASTQACAISKNEKSIY